MKLSIPVLPAIAFMVTSLCIASANAQTMSQKDYCHALITALQEGLPGPQAIVLAQSDLRGGQIGPGQDVIIQDLFVLGIHPESDDDVG